MLLPVLSRRWAGLLQGPDPAWADVNITGADFYDGTLPDGMAISAWFCRRVGSVRTLSLDWTVPKLPASVVTAALVSQAMSLRQLELSLVATQLSSADLACTTVVLQDILLSPCSTWPSIVQLFKVCRSSGEYCSAGLYAPTTHT